MKIADFQPKDVGDILELFFKAFNKPMTGDYWKWRYAQNPFNDKPYINLMWEDELLIGHYAVSPLQMTIDDRVENVALSMTTMTHPAFNGRGIFTKLAQKVYGRIEDDGFHLVYGFPNNNSHYGLVNKLGWKNLTTIPFLIFNAENCSRLPKLNVKVEPINSINQIPEGFFIRNDKRIQINKTNAFINWRYFQNQSFKYRFIKIEETIFIYKIIKSFTNDNLQQVDIVEIGGSLSLESLTAFLSFIHQSEKAIEKFNVWVSIFDVRHAFFEKAGFKLSDPVTYLTYLPFRNAKSENLQYYNHWDISFSYSDVF